MFGNCSSNIKLLLNGKEIGKTESVKYLGLLIGDKLKWINHIDNVYNKVIKYVGFKKKIKFAINCHPQTIIFCFCSFPHQLRD